MILPEERFENLTTPKDGRFINRDSRMTGIDDFAKKMAVQRHGSITLPDTIDWNAQKGLIRYVAAQLTKLDIIERGGLIIINAPGALQKLRRGNFETGNQTADVIHSLHKEFGERALVGVVGLDMTQNYSIGDPEAIEALTTYMENRDDLLTCQIGTAPGFERSTKLTLPDHTTRFTLSRPSRSRGSALMYENPSDVLRDGIEVPTGYIRL